MGRCGRRQEKGVHNIYIIGDAVKVFDTFEYGGGESEDSIQDVLNTFEKYCNPRRNTIYERYKFQCRHQEGGW